MRLILLLIGSALIPLGGTEARADFLYGDSLSTPFIESRAKIRVLHLDDRLDTNCRNRHFLRVRVVPDPVSITRNGITERKWQEQWTLDRCGTPVGYRVFFTEVGDGGVYFSVRRMD